MSDDDMNPTNPLSHTPKATAMSDTTPTPNDAAIAVITERARELETEILGHQRCIDVATASRNELLDLIATLSRKPRPRKVRAVPEAANDIAEAPRQTVFATPTEEAA